MRDRLQWWWKCHPSTAHWMPAIVLKVDVVRLSWILAALSFIRGLDYLTGRDSALSIIGGGTPAVSPLVGIESAFPLWLWGISLCGWGLLLVFGIVSRWHTAVWLGHFMLSALYAGLAVGLTYGYLERPFFDGIRNGTIVFLPYALHTLLWWRMGPFPDEAEDRCDMEAEQ